MRIGAVDSPLRGNDGLKLVIFRRSLNNILPNNELLIAREKHVDKLVNTEFVAIGGSLGSTRALTLILAQLPSDFPIPIAVVVHRQASADSYLVTALQKHCKLNVREAIDKQTIKPGTVTLAPANYHLMIDNGHYALNIDEAVNGARPSIDLLFESVASNYIGAALGVILTGGGTDGAAGVMAIIDKHGEVLVEDPLTAQSGEMPSAAIAAVDTCSIYSLKQLGEQIVQRGNL